MTGADRREAAEKLAHADGLKRDAERQRDMIAGALADGGLPAGLRLSLETELHVADHRVALYRDVVRELRKQASS